MPATWVDSPAEWDDVARALWDHPEGAGLDTEYYRADGGDPRKRSATEVLVHVWSVALPTDSRSPRGYHRAESVVLPAAALLHDGINRWLYSPQHRKLAHNAGVDCHALVHTAAELGRPLPMIPGVEDTLQIARWLWPERAKNAGGGGYDLKTLARSVLGRNPLGHYDEVFSEHLTRERVVRDCACRTPRCTRRRLPEHAKTERVVTEQLKGKRMIPLQEIVPGHRKWDTLVPYAGEDAEFALELAEVEVREGAGDRMRRLLPW